MLMLDF